MKYYEAIKKRRSRYDLKNTSIITDERIEEIVSNMITYTPSAFHSQSSRVVLLFNEDHLKLWNIVEKTLEARVPADKFEGTRNKLATFAAAHGTILYFEDMDTVKGLQNDFPSYAENFPIWSNQSAGMLQFSIWTALSQEGLGASIQHYNPLIDEEVKKVFSVPKNWKLLAQMPFGDIVNEPNDLTYKPIEERLIVRRKE